MDSKKYRLDLSEPQAFIFLNKFEKKKFKKNYPEITVQSVKNQLYLVDSSSKNKSTVDFDSVYNQIEDLVAPFQLKYVGTNLNLLENQEINDLQDQIQIDILSKRIFLNFLAKLRERELMTLADGFERRMTKKDYLLIFEKENQQRITRLLKNLGCVQDQKQIQIDLELDGKQLIKASLLQLLKSVPKVIYLNKEDSLWIKGPQDACQTLRDSIKKGLTLWKFKAIYSAADQCTTIKQAEKQQPGFKIFTQKHVRKIAKEFEDQYEIDTATEQYFRLIAQKKHFVFIGAESGKENTIDPWVKKVLAVNGNGDQHSDEFQEKYSKVNQKQVINSKSPVVNNTKSVTSEKQQPQRQKPSRSRSIEDRSQPEDDFQNDESDYSQQQQKPKPFLGNRKILKQVKVDRRIEELSEEDVYYYFSNNRRITKNDIKITSEGPHIAKITLFSKPNLTPEQTKNMIWSFALYFRYQTHIFLKQEYSDYAREFVSQRAQIYGQEKISLIFGFCRFKYYDIMKNEENRKELTSAIRKKNIQKNQTNIYPFECVKYEGLRTTCRYIENTFAEGLKDVQAMREDNWKIDYPAELKALVYAESVKKLIQKFIENYFKKLSLVSFKKVTFNFDSAQATIVYNRRKYEDLEGEKPKIRALLTSNMHLQKVQLSVTLDKLKSLCPITDNDDAVYVEGQAKSLWIVGFTSVPRFVSKVVKLVQSAKTSKEIPIKEYLFREVSKDLPSQLVDINYKVVSKVVERSQADHAISITGFVQDVEAKYQSLKEWLEKVDQERCIKMHKMFQPEVYQMLQESSVLKDAAARHIIDFSSTVIEIKNVKQVLLQLRTHHKKSEKRLKAFQEELDTCLSKAKLTCKHTISTRIQGEVLKYCEANSLNIEEQKNIGNGAVQLRVSSYCQKDLDQLKFKIICLNLDERVVPGVPLNWTPSPTLQTELVEVDKDSAEFKRVSNQFMIGYSIRKLTRVQNFYIWKKYFQERLSLQQRLGSQPRELYLMHGTKNTNPEVIYLDMEETFNINHASEKSIFGKGIYFSAGNVHESRFKKEGLKNGIVLFCRVLVGVSQEEKGPSKLTEGYLDTKVRDFSKNIKYDSVHCMTENGDLFVLYKSRRAYPEYVIEY